jgi:hypothetical protein
MAKKLTLVLATITVAISAAATQLSSDDAPVSLVALQASAH